MIEMTNGDFCIVVYRADDAWEAEVLPVAVAEHLGANVPRRLRPADRCAPVVTLERCTMCLAH
jgi:hypothetical protein